LRIEAEKRDQRKQAYLNAGTEQDGAEMDVRAAEAEARAAEGRQMLRAGGKMGARERAEWRQEEGAESGEEGTEPEREEETGVGASLLLEKPTSSLDDTEESEDARAHEEEPIYLQKDLPIWELHTQPSEDWVERGRRILDQCRLDDSDGVTSAAQNSNPAVKGEITLVTALLDLGRGKDDNGMFKRGMDEYFARFQRILDRGFPMVVYMPGNLKEHLRIDEARVQVRELTVDGLKDEALFGPYWNTVQVRRRACAFKNINLL
jgi:hypothetical protein